MSWANRDEATLWVRARVAPSSDVQVLAALSLANYRALNSLSTTMLPTILGYAAQIVTLALNGVAKLMMLLERNVIRPALFLQGEPLYRSRPASDGYLSR